MNSWYIQFSPIPRSCLIPSQLDNTKFAEKGGFANANSARVAWHGLKKKLNKAAGVDVFNGKASDGASKDGSYTFLYLTSVR